MEQEKPPRLASDPGEEIEYPPSWRAVAETYRTRGIALDLANVRTRFLFDLPQGAEQRTRRSLVTPPHLRFLELRPQSAVTLAATLFHYRPVRPLLNLVRHMPVSLLSEILPGVPANELVARLDTLAQCADTATVQLRELGSVLLDGKVKRAGRGPGRRRLLVLEVVRSLSEYLSSLPRPFAGADLVKQIDQLLQPVFPDQATAKEIDAAIRHEVQYKTNFAKRGSGAKSP
jgi:hypothetical protein